MTDFLKGWSDMDDIIWENARRESMASAYDQTWLRDKYREAALSGLFNDQVSNFEIRAWGDPPSNHQLVKLKVTLSRPLTWSEREFLRVEFTSTFRSGSQKVIDGALFLEVDSQTQNDPSRDVAWELHEFLARQFFNVHIRAAHTLSPKVNV